MAVKWWCDPRDGNGDDDGNDNDNDDAGTGEEIIQFVTDAYIRLRLRFLLAVIMRMAVILQYNLYILLPWKSSAVAWAHVHMSCYMGESG